MTIIERLQSAGIRRVGSPARGFRYLGQQGKNVTRAERALLELLR